MFFNSEIGGEEKTSYPSVVHNLHKIKKMSFCIISMGPALGSKGRGGQITHLRRTLVLAHLLSNFNFGSSSSVTAFYNRSFMPPFITNPSSGA